MRFMCHVSLPSLVSDPLLPFFFSLSSQVVICNPERTGVKVFLVPYNFEDMPPKSHTFLRQRTLLRASSSHASEDRGRSVLCFAIHLRFTCSRRGTVYLHRSVHVVFAGMSPDKDAVLDTVVEGPADPVYTPWSKSRRSRGCGSRQGQNGDATQEQEEQEQGQKASAGAGAQRQRKGSASTAAPALQRRPPLEKVPFALDADGCPQPAPASMGGFRPMDRCHSPTSPKHRGGGGHGNGAGLGVFGVAPRGPGYGHGRGSSPGRAPLSAVAPGRRAAFPMADSDDDALM